MQPTYLTLTLQRKIEFTENGHGDMETPTAQFLQVVSTSQDFLRPKTWNPKFSDLRVYDNTSKGHQGNGLRLGHCSDVWRVLL